MRNSRFEPILLRQLPWTILILFSIAHAAVEDWLPEELESVCSTNDLDHSKLIECKPTYCAGEPSSREKSPALMAPENYRKALHFYSSRSGDRFGLNLVDSLSYTQTNFEKSMDINTTLYVNTQSTSGEFHGFGTTIDLGSIWNRIVDVDDDYTLPAIIKQLFSRTNQHGLHLSLLRVPISRETLTNGRVMSVLKKIDNMLIKALGDEGLKIKLVLSFEYWPSGENSTAVSIEDIRCLEKITLEGLEVLECWAVTTPPNPNRQGFVDEGLRDFIRDRCFKTENLFIQVPMDDATRYVEKLSTESKGLLVQSDFKSTYSNIDKVLALRKGLSVLAIGSAKSLVGDYGNWQTAQHHALEIMNHLKHESLAFIESHSVIDVFDEGSNQRDGSIYNLGSKYETFFKGPMFYALGHFSQHLVPGSKRLQTEISTQPNMFAADYMAFITPQDNVVAIVLNDNEHDLPFRLAIDDRIRLHVMLRSKSFNTIVIKA